MLGRTKAKKMRRKRDANRNRGGGRMEEREIDSRREQEPDANSGEEGRWGVETKWGEERVDF